MTRDYETVQDVSLPIQTQRVARLPHAYNLLGNRRVSSTNWKLLSFHSNICAHLAILTVQKEQM